MVESSSSSASSSGDNEPVCAQLLTQLNTAYQHLAPDAQALVSRPSSYVTLIDSMTVQLLVDPERLLEMVKQFVCDRIE